MKFLTGRTVQIYSSPQLGRDAPLALEPLNCCCASTGGGQASSITGKINKMPSFDVVSEVDKHSLTNSVDQASRLIGNRFDFKGVDAKFELNEQLITLFAEADFQIEQMFDVLNSALHKNKIDIKCLSRGDLQQSGKQVKQEITVRTGLDTLLSKKMVKMIKDSKLKVQAQIQGDQLRVNGKKRDDLQAVMALLRESDIDLPLQFTNFRD